MSEKRKIVLDTNCLIASLSRRGQYFHLIEEDHDDDKFVDCAFAANATFIVSGDHGVILMIIFQDRQSINGNVNETSNELQ